MPRKLRIVTGMILFVFVTMHLSNLCLGVISVDLVDKTRPGFMLLWTNPVGGTLLVISALVHMAMGLQALYRRNTLKMTTEDTVQFVSALIIPPLMIPHVWGIIATVNMLEVEVTFTSIFRFFWIDAPQEGLRQVLLVVAIWTHGCIGMFTWLRLKSWWPRVSGFIYPLAVAIPVLALLGFVEGGNAALEAMFSPTANTPTQQPSPLSPEDVASTLAFINQTKMVMIYFYLAAVAAVLFGRWFRLRGRADFVKVRYADGRVVKAPVGMTLLEIANINDVPHANLCRGRGRCGTCRVIIHKSDSELPPPSDIESQTLKRLDSPDNTRLACQIIPGPGRIRIERLLQPDIKPQELHSASQSSSQKAPASTMEQAT